MKMVALHQIEEVVKGEAVTRKKGDVFTPSAADRKFYVEANAVRAATDDEIELAEAREEQAGVDARRVAEQAAQAEKLAQAGRTRSATDLAASPTLQEIEHAADIERENQAEAGADLPQATGPADAETPSAAPVVSTPAANTEVKETGARRGRPPKPNPLD